MIRATENLPGNGYRWPFQRGAERSAQWIAVFLPIAIVLPTAWLSIAEVLLLISWALSGRYGLRYRQIGANPVALAALALFGLLLVGTLYSRVGWSESFDTVDNYLVLLFVPIIVSIFDKPIWRDRAFIAVLIGVAIIVLVVYLRWAGVLSPAHGVRMAFKNHITEGLMLSFGCFLIAHRAMNSPGRRFRWLLALCLILAPLFFLYGSKSGYVVFAVLYLLFFWQRFSWKALFPAVAILVAATALLWSFSGVFQTRVGDGLSGFTEYQPGTISDSSVSIRLEYYENSLRLIAKYPLAGVGTGGFASGYREVVEGMDPPVAWITEHPHNEYLFLAAEHGIGGALLFLLLLAVQWVSSFKLDITARPIAQGIAVAMAVACLFNSALLDFTDGAWFGLMSGIVFSALHRSPDQEAPLSEGVPSSA